MYRLTAWTGCSRIAAGGSRTRPATSGAGEAGVTQLPAPAAPRPLHSSQKYRKARYYVLNGTFVSRMAAAGHAAVTPDPSAPGVNQGQCPAGQVTALADVNPQAILEQPGTAMNQPRS